MAAGPVTFTVNVVPATDSFHDAFDGVGVSVVGLRCTQIAHRDRSAESMPAIFTTEHLTQWRVVRILQHPRRLWRRFANDHTPMCGRRFSSALPSLSRQVKAALPRYSQGQFVEHLGHLANSDAGGRVGRQDRDGMSLSHLRQ